MRSRRPRRRGADLATGARHTPVVMVGGGQAGLAAGYHLRGPGGDFLILDAQAEPGSAWQNAWDSPHMFSPAAFLAPAGTADAAAAGRGASGRRARGRASLRDHEKPARA